MKKAILTCGLFSLMLVLTSFQSSDIGSNDVLNNSTVPYQSEIGGNKGAPQDKSLPLPYTYEIGGNKGAPQDKGLGYYKLDIGGNKGAPKNPELPAA